MFGERAVLLGVVLAFCAEVEASLRKRIAGRAGIEAAENFACQFQIFDRRMPLIVAGALGTLWEWQDIGGRDIGVTAFGRCRC